MGRSSGLYDHLPIPVQTLVVTGYGMVLHRRRYGAEHRRWLARLLKSQWLSGEVVRSQQLQALRRVVDDAFVHVPYYREAYARAGYQVGALQKTEDLSALPIVDKEEVRRDPRAFISERFPARALYEGHTSGTSGKPLLTYKTRSCYQRNWAFQERVRSWFDIRFRAPRVTLNARPVVPPQQHEPPFWRQDLFTANWHFSVFHLSAANLPAYVSAMAAIAPVEIHGYPSAIVEVARAAIELGESRIRPRAVVTSSETLLDTQRELMERAFGCAVRDQYGCAENVVWVSQCAAGTYHSHPEYGYLETVEDGKPVLDRAGEVLGTGFINPAMPLIRYRLGDTMVVSSQESCVCGRSFPVVTQLVGRTDDVLYSPDGKPLGRLDPLFKGLESIVEGQFVQDETDHLTVRLVASGPAERDVADLGGRIRDAFGPSMRVTMEFTDSIPRTEAGKFRFQRNLVQGNVQRSLKA